jgi:hypothetical protein
LYQIQIRRDGRLLLAPALAACVMFAVAFSVIPLVQTNPLSADTAAPSFWANVIANGIAVVVFYAAYALCERRARVTQSLLWIGGTLALVLAFFLFDAGRAFTLHGPAMQNVTAMLYVCAAAEAIAGALALTIAIRRRAAI